MLQLGGPSMARIVAQSRQIVRMKKKTKKNKKEREKEKMNKKKSKRKIDCHVTHLKNSIISKRESRKPNSRKSVKKND